MERKSSNPYQELPRFVKHYAGRKAAQEELIEKLRKGVNTVVMGVEGVGKSALLGSVFTPEYCRRLVLEEEEPILVNQISYQTDLANGDIYYFFADSVRDAAEILADCGKKALYEDIKSRADQYKKENSTPQGYFQRICKYIHSKHCHVVLVIDQFERFTSSKNVEKDHHDVMRNVLVDKNLCFVVATDYDFDKEALPKNASGSLLLQLFAGHEIPLKGLDQEECGIFLRGISGGDDFTPEELGKLSRLTGGIPHLLCRAAYYALEQKEAGEDISWRDVKESVLRDCGGLMDRWLGILTTQETELLGELAGQIEDAVPVRVDLRDGAVPLLLKRGLIVDLGDDCYNFNSRLFQDYCIQHPPKPRPPQEPTSGLPPQPGLAPVSLENLGIRPPLGPSTVIYYEDKSTHIYNEEGTIESGAIQIQNPSFQSHGMSVSELLGILNGGGDLQKTLTDRLTQRLTEYRKVPSLSEAVREQSYDEAFSQAGSDLLAVDEDQELINVSAQEQETLDERFSQACTRCHRNLSNELLDLMSERCRLYLKMSVIVEDALSIVGGKSMPDYSPHLVLYGKALEQALRDNLFQLFQREEQLSIYDTYANCEDRNSPYCFRKKNARTSFIGNFIYLIRSKADYLGKLCAEAGICAPTGALSEEQWCDWWKDFKDQIDKARNIRNLADHPDDRIPTTDDLDDMCEVLLGTKESPGVLAQTTVGKELFSKLFSSAIDDLEEASEEMVAAEELVGKIVVITGWEMTKRKIKKSGDVKIGLRGHYKSYQVNLPSEHLLDGQAEQLEGEASRLEVELVSWDPNPQTPHFIAKLLKNS